jgi:hypothetical protein
MIYEDPAYKSISNSPTQYSIEFNLIVAVIKPYDPNTSGGVSPKAHQIRLQVVSSTHIGLKVGTRLNLA